MGSGHDYWCATGYGLIPNRAAEDGGEGPQSGSR